MGFLADWGVIDRPGVAARKPPVFLANQEHPDHPAPRGVSNILRRNARSRVRLTDRALSLN